MKALLTTLSLILFIPMANANTHQCINSLNLMTKLTKSYTIATKKCIALEAQGDTSSRIYEGYSRVSRNIENTYSRVQDNCYRTCTDTFFCEFQLAGACKQK